MGLSNRANRFLANAKWKNSVHDEKDIRHAFEAVKLIPTEKLIDFQKRYGGLTIYAYLEPIVYGILHQAPSRGAFANETGLIITEPEDDIVVRHFACADTLYQETFTIDEDGRYYEGFELKCNHFETHVESMAMLEQVKKGKWKIVYEFEPDVYRDCYETIDWKQYGELVKRLGLKKVEDFPDDVISWDTNGEILVWRKADAVIVLSEGSLKQAEQEMVEEIFPKE
ncbi:hypothetical protein [Brevibacillus reuszeri]|uniref:hypothetical protein n=1 Tax=Brevibacillus reuszeri TaxID=54915 RepID=UPI003D21DB56